MSALIGMEIDWEHCSKSGSGVLLGVGYSDVSRSWTALVLQDDGSFVEINIVFTVTKMRRKAVSP